MFLYLLNTFDLVRYVEIVEKSDNLQELECPQPLNTYIDGAIVIAILDLPGASNPGINISLTVLKPSLFENHQLVSFSFVSSM